MTRPGRSLAASIAAETARMLNKRPNRAEEFVPLEAFFDRHRERLVRGLLPGLKPDGARGFVVLIGEPNALRGRLIRLEIDNEFSSWRAADGSAGIGAYSLVCWMLGPDTPALLLAAASAKTLLSRERRP